MLNPTKHDYVLLCNYTRVQLLFLRSNYNIYFLYIGKLVYTARFLEQKKKNWFLYISFVWIE
jgi:hypothetical protein